MSEHIHKVKAEVLGQMDDEGEIKLNCGGTLKIDLSELQTPKEWADDEDMYIITDATGASLETTCGVIRQILKNRK